jgi:hypothetical protein
MQIKQIYISLHGLLWIQNYFHNVSQINIIIFVDTLGCYSTIILVLQIRIARVNLAKSYIDVLQFFIWLQISPSIKFSLAEMQIFFLNLTYSYMAMTVHTIGCAKICTAPTKSTPSFDFPIALAGQKKNHSPQLCHNLANIKGRAARGHALQQPYCTRRHIHNKTVHKQEAARADPSLRSSSACLGIIKKLVLPAPERKYILCFEESISLSTWAE